ncbi:MAG TPA: ParB N-terminal domain-containing protein [Calidithermus sp.]|nr:ParB N-terminal domain-containing protein [Calidithermus sp.]
MDARTALATVLHKTPEPRPTAGLRHYAPRWIWPPDYRRSWEWQKLCQTVADCGLREPLVALADGRVIDGGHRLEAAQAVGLEQVPVLVADVPLPLDDDARWAIEEWAVVNAIARRHLTRAETVRLLIDLEQAADQWERQRVRLANLRRGAQPGQPLRVVSRAEDFAALTGLSVSHVKRVLTIARRAPAELRERVRAGQIGVTRAYQELQAELDRAVAERAPGGARVTPSALEQYRGQLHLLVEALEALAAQLDHVSRRQQEAYLEIVASAESRTQRNLERLEAWRQRASA